MSGVNAGTSVRLSYQTLTQADIENALREVLENEKYKINAKRRSSLFRDQLETPLERAIYWCEWLIRHPHDYTKIKLTRIIELGWFAANSYDMLLLAVGVVAVIVLTLSRLFKKNKVSVSNTKIKKNQ